ncbi:GDP-mannose 4,6-dehydratase [Candidatus Pelagibacter sp. HIMB1593]|uniref:GDP-mannose 4,6-dehydratase n=1 Tax=Candidatus Pelagibacter sp. HIMB1593 TaxID=3413355 RepID=UPI003F8690CF
MNKRVNLIIGSGVLGAYLSAELLKNNEKIIVTSRNLNNKFSNYKYLNIKKKLSFEKLNPGNKKEIYKILNKYNPKKIFYFSGQSSIPKSIKLKKATFSSHYVGTKNFLEILKKEKSDTKFLKANSGYIFSPKKGLINLDCKYSTSKNPYIQTQKEVFKLIKKYRKYKLNLFNLVFMQIESPIRPNDFFIKKICLAAKNKKRVEVGNINTFRDYSWITEVVRVILKISNLKSKDFIISAGKKLSGIEILKTAYNLNKLDYKKYFSINKKYFRKKENKLLIGNSKNSLMLKKKFNFKFNIVEKKLIRKMYKSL